MDAGCSAAASEARDTGRRTRRQENLKRALRARHIAFIGGRAIEDSIRLCERAGFEGEIWPVHPTYESLGGRPCYRSIADLPEAPDAALLAVSRERTVDMVRELARIGAGAAISITGEFAETDATGVALQQALHDAAGELALVGPNCLGIMNLFDGVAIWGGDNAFHPVSEPGVALIYQSGYVAYSITNVEQAFPLGYAISIGNQAVLDVSDYIDVVLDDARVSAIGLYLEGLVDVAALSDAALRAVEMGVPVIVLKAGGTEAGAELTTSHSGTLAVADDLWRALFDRLGMVEVFSPKTLVEMLRDFRTLLLPVERRQIAEALSVLTIVRRLKLDETSLSEIVEAIFAIAQFADDHRGALAELDVNPLVLCENGDVFAIDALIRMETKSKAT